MERLTLEQRLQDAMLSRLEAIPAHNPAPTLTSAQQFGAASASQIRGMDGVKQIVYEPFQLLAAIERKDLETLFRIRDHQFSLLVEPNQGVIPLVFAMRIGETHRDMAILLTGAISRRVNDLTDEDLTVMSTATKATLRSIRASLRIAITYGLATAQTTLLASYLQISLISSGSKWLLASANVVSLAFALSSHAKPVEAAASLVENWIGKELKEVVLVATVGEFLANAIGDLVAMGLWNHLLEAGSTGDVIPTYFFARDDRVTKCLRDRIDTLKASGRFEKVAVPTTRKQVEIVLDVLSRREVGGKERIAILRQALDDP